MRHSTVLLLALFALSCSFAALPAHAQATDQRCFTETGQCIGGPIRARWEQGGGLAVFGLPLTPLREEAVEGRTTLVQWFERTRLELDPGATLPSHVRLGRIGADLLTAQGRD